MTKNKESAGMTKVRRDRKEEILQEATKLFGVYGFRGTTLSSVAKAVGLTEPGLLHYYPSKVDLLQGVLEYRDKQDGEKYSTFIDPDNMYLLEFFETLEELTAQNEQIPGLIRLFTVLVGESIRKDHPSHDYFVNRYEQIRMIFTEYLSNLSDDEDIPSDINIGQLSSITVAVMDGLQIQWLLDPDNVNMSGSFNLFSKIMVEYLKR